MYVWGYAYIYVYVCMCVYMYVCLYVCNIGSTESPPECHSLRQAVLTCFDVYPSMLAGRIFLPFISKWLGREMGFYVPLSLTREPGSVFGWLLLPHNVFYKVL